MSCKTGGCSSEGSSGCNKKNTFDWFADIPIASNYNFNIIEVSFKQGARKGFYRNDKKIDLYKGDLVLVEAAQGYDIGEVSLKGELVKLQMKKKKVKDTPENVRKIIKKATELHKDELKELRSRERDIMIKARVISRELKLNMKVGDIEFQGDGKKATIYYTSEGRIDFRELV
ncbi:MAG: regulatory iron-sulfur-containing complex subunit RicT, partial [Chitinophagales bacterium]